MMRNDDFAVFNFGCGEFVVTGSDGEHLWIYQIDRFGERKLASIGCDAPVVLLKDVYVSRIEDPYSIEMAALKAAGWEAWS